MFRMNHEDDMDDDSYSFDMESDEDVAVEESPKFLALCKITRELNLAALRELNNRYLDMYVNDDNGESVISPDGISPMHQEPLVELMVKEENDAAVAMLLQELQVKHYVLERAIESYCAVGRFHKVEELLRDYGNADVLSCAILNYARYGHHEKVDAIHLDHALLLEVQEVYAYYGHFQQAERLVFMGGTVETLISGYAFGGHYNQVNSWIELGLGRQETRERRMAAYQGFHAFRNEEKVLKFLSHLDNPATRIFLIDTARDAHFHRLDKKSLLANAKSLNHIMRQYQLNYEQAQVLRIPGVREWMLHARKRGSQIGRLPHDLVIKTAMELTHLSYQETEKIYLAVCKNTHDGARHLILGENSLFAKRYGMRGGEVRAARHKHELEALEARYDTKKRRVGQ